MIDYTKHADLSEYLMGRHHKEAFDAIFDVVGDVQLHKECPAYLTEKGMFVSLGGMKQTREPGWLSLLGFGIPVKLERYRPVWLGGVPREHRMYTGVGDLKSLKQVVRMVDERKMELPIDSVWRMEDVLQVCCLIHHEDEGL